MFLVDWDSVATDSVLDQLRDLAGADKDPDNAALRPIVSVILSNAGGLPLTDSDWSEKERAEVCQKLLHEATGFALRGRIAERPLLPGCELGDGGSGLDRKLVDAKRVSVNVATAEELEPLPVLGPTTAPRTVEERRKNGGFSSALELAQRVRGVFDSAAERMALRLDFGLPDGRPAPPADFKTDFQRLVAEHSGESGKESLVHSLEYLATITSEHPHPYTLAHRRRTDLPKAKANGIPAEDADSVEILEDEQYYFRLKKLLAGADQRIHVAMFFVSLTSKEHPSRDLLETLAGASADGKAVRVLVDRDSDDDPYGSRVINKPAVDFLKDQGVPVRFDTTENLLHSKFVIVDDTLSIIGSHNWTAGSYFRYRDTSVAVTSKAFNQRLTDRFKKLWDSGTDA